MNPLRQLLTLDLLSRMADLIDSGMDPDDALHRAAEDMKHAVRAARAQATADAFREADTTVH